MAEQTIRDVIIRCKLKVVDDASLKGSTAQIKKTTQETEKQAQAVEKVKTKVKTVVQQEKERTQLLKEQMKVEALRDKRLLEQLKFDKERLKIQQQMEKLNSKPAPGEVAIKGSSKANKPQNMQDPSLQIGGTSMKIAKLFAATMIIEQLPETLKSAATGEIFDKMAVVGLGIVEGFEGVIVGLGDLVNDMITASGGGPEVKGFASGILGAPKALLDGMFGGPMGGGAPSATDRLKIRPALGGKIRAGLEGMGIDPGGTIEEMKRAKLAAIIERQATLEQQKIDIVKKLIPAENELLKITKEKIADAKTEFGMLTAREQEGLLATSRRIDKVGFGGLGQDEAEQFRNNHAIAALYAQKAAAQAENGESGRMFSEIVERSGTGKVLAREQASQDKKNREAIMAINELHIMDALAINVDPTKVAETMTAKVAPILKEALERTAEKLKDDLARAGRLVEGARSAAGAAGRLK